jgi:peptidoglycan hydrolase CwlO-like protein
MQKEHVIYSIVIRDTEAAQFLCVNKQYTKILKRSIGSILEFTVIGSIYQNKELVICNDKIKDFKNEIIYLKFDIKELQETVREKYREIYELNKKIDRKNKKILELYKENKELKERIKKNRM